MENNTIAEVQLYFYEQPIVIETGMIANTIMIIKGSANDLYFLIVSAAQSDPKFKDAVLLAASFINQNQ